MDNEGVKAIADLAKASNGIEIVTLTIPGTDIEAPFALRQTDQGGFEVRSVKPQLDEWRSAPERRAGRATTHTLQDFIGLTKRHAVDGESAIFGNFTGSQPSLTTVVDYHTTDREARFCDHRIVYDFPLSVEWTAWKACNAKPFSQIEWAAWIEEHIADLASPNAAEKNEFERLFQTKFATPSELMTLSRGMQVTVEGNFKDIRVLQSGEAEISFTEVHKDGAGQKLVVPGLFVISIPMFLNGDPVRITARLRYRRDGQSIRWFYQLYRVDLALQAQLEADLGTASKETGLPAFQGTPEA